ncbi:MAG: ribonuclease III [Prochlorotrichaceae cyanobacterium]
MLAPPRQKQIERLIQKLGLGLVPALRWDLLDRALCHPSASLAEDYEHLEFLGDGVIRLAAAQFLTETYPHLSVGELAAIRSVLVSDRILTEIATVYSLDRYILTSPEVKLDTIAIPRRLAEALEALLGALYLSCQDLSLVRSWLDGHFQPLAEAVLADPARQNYKAALQEWTQAHYQSLPDYRVIEQNPQAGAKDRFSAEVWFQGNCLGKGQGRSIKLAEQAAAQEAVLLHGLHSDKPITLGNLP